VAAAVLGELIGEATACGVAWGGAGTGVGGFGAR
jgi:hypothetical protein